MARGVYRATSHLDGDKSWSQFVEKALMHEAEAREHSHNGGQRYDDSDAQLSAGRPLSDIRCRRGRSRAVRGSRRAAQFHPGDEEHYRQSTPPDVSPTRVADARIHIDAPGRGICRGRRCVGG
ncbi:hypothetical protein [Rhodococcus sp. BP-110]|uniref:ParB family protein n=1 Tax=unclassified Rhodococcus (in: high G+C Gram-positive bacteria) TaxID=192944 RepID=UPI0035ABBE28